MGGQRHAPAALLQGKRPCTHCTGSWMGPRAGLDLCGNPCPTGILSPGRSSRLVGFSRVCISAGAEMFFRKVRTKTELFQPLVFSIITLVAVLYFLSLLLGHGDRGGVAQWLSCCATNRKVAGSIPVGVGGFFIDIDIDILLITLWPWSRLSL